jgi:hypothetical protein
VEVTIFSFEAARAGAGETAPEISAKATIMPAQ